MDGFDRNSSLQPSDRLRASPSYFKNVVALGVESGSVALSPRLSSKPKSSSSTTETDNETTTEEHNEIFQGGNSTLRVTSKDLQKIQGNLVFPDICDEGNHNMKHDAIVPLLSSIESYNPNDSLQRQDATPKIANVRSRKGNANGGGATNQQRIGKQQHRGRRCKRRSDQQQQSSGGNRADNTSTSCSSCCCCGKIFWCCQDRKIVRNTLSCMKVVARILSWCTVIASVAGVVWYSYELKKTG